MKIKNLIALSIVIVFCLIAVIAILPHIPLSFRSDPTVSYSGFVDIWHIESFEGGSGSRATFLKRRALEFEQANTGLLMHVTVYTAEQALAKLEKGDKFDIISFSYGAGSSLLQYLATYEGSLFGIYDNFLDCGQIEQATYAVPYMSGVYGLFTRKTDFQRLPKDSTLSDNVFKLTYDKRVGKNTVAMRAVDCGFSQFNSPLTALHSVASVGKLAANYQQTQYQAYQKFVANNAFAALLGTQRDMFRLKNRMSQGKIEQLVFEPLNGFCDLVQYMGISKTAGEDKAVATKFVEYLLNPKSQQKLCDIAMFSVTGKFYTDEWYTAAQAALLQCTVPNVFTSVEQLAKLRVDAQTHFA